MNESGFSIQLEVYEGPMDLLLHVVRQRQIDFSELCLAQIAQDFLQFARTEEKLDLDSAGEVLYIAAILIRMKIRNLLPGDEQEELFEKELLLDRDEDLEEVYRSIVAAARRLAEGEATQRDYFPRGEAADIVQPDLTDVMMQDVTLVHLAEAFREVTRRLEKSGPRQLSMFKVTVEDQTLVILKALESVESIRFEDLVAEFTERIEAVVTFLAMLEMIRSGKIVVKQPGLFGAILILRGPAYHPPKQLYSPEMPDAPDLFETE